MSRKEPRRREIRLHFHCSSAVERPFRRGSEPHSTGWAFLGSGGTSTPGFLGTVDTALEGPVGIQTFDLHSADRNTNTVTRFYSGGPSMSPVGRTIDVETGDYIVLDNQSSAAKVFRIRAGGGSTSTLASLPLRPTTQVTQLIQTGGFDMGAYKPTMSPSVFMKVSLGGKVTTVFGMNNPHVAATSVSADRSSPGSPRLANGSCCNTPGLYCMDVNTAAITIMFIPSSSCTFTHVFPDRCRNVATLKRAPRMWDVLLNFRRDAGRGYVVGLSLSGYSCHSHVYGARTKSAEAPAYSDGFCPGNNRRNSRAIPPTLSWHRTSADGVSAEPAPHVFCSSS